MKNNKGFTLIELMIVVAIIGIVAAVVLPLFTKDDKSGKVNNRHGTIQSQAVSSAPVHTAIFACANGELYIDNVKSDKACKNSVTGIEIVQ